MINFKNIWSRANWGLIVYQGDTGKSVYANNYAKQTLNAPEIEFCVFDMITEPKRSNVKYLNKDLLTSESFSTEICFKKLDGQFIYAELGTMPVEGEENLFAIMFKDITYQLKLRRDLMAKQDEITKTYEDLLKQNEQLKELDKAKDRFIALISHELRTPLSAMIATSEVLKMGLVDSEEQVKEFNETIYEQGQYLLEIVNDILDFAKIRAGRIDLYVEEDPVKDFLDKIVTQFSKFAEDKQIQLQVTMTNEECRCYFDEKRLRQVVSNVLSNAIKFSPRNSTVHLEVQEDDSMAFILIKDEGDGIPEDKIDAIFDEFVTLENINSHQKGTGLGMPISRKLSELMGGKLKVDTNYKDGACFVISLPKQRILDDEVYRPKPMDGEIDLSQIA
tara:strand:+ start:8787 stop:9959 length:1173 start_codon:yes stop_codon:yes gene_type:complete